MRGRAVEMGLLRRIPALLTVLALCIAWALWHSI